MFKVYYSNQLSYHKDLLISILSTYPNQNPFEEETILVQSTGMAQWLQMEVAQKLGVSGNIAFTFPNQFVWQQYRSLFPELPKENVFERDGIVWRLMRLIPRLQKSAEFAPLDRYLQDADQLKYYQLANYIADLFDQYLIYRPEWLVIKKENHRSSDNPDYQMAWNEKQVLSALRHRHFSDEQRTTLESTVRWQGLLWNALVNDIALTYPHKDKPDGIPSTYRPYLQHRYFEELSKLGELAKHKIPKRIFVFGISSLPVNQLEMLKKLSQYCDVYLFFTNPSNVYWGDTNNEKLMDKLLLNEQILPNEIEKFMGGNPLLSIWGRQGRAFLNLLEEQQLDINDDPYAYEEYLEQSSLLASVKRAILENSPTLAHQIDVDDDSIHIHVCHSKMREVEVLHNHLLAMFEKDPDLSPKDIIVMSPDIDSYAPYVKAVFSRYSQTNRYIPFTLSDQSLRIIDPVIAGFIELLSLKEKRFSVEEIFTWLNISAVREKFGISEAQLATLREWIPNIGVRAGLYQTNPQWENYNSWDNGVARLMLGIAFKEEHFAWENVVAFDESYGLNAELSGKFARFLEVLTDWHQRVQKAYTAEVWQGMLLDLLQQFYSSEGEQSASVSKLQKAVVDITDKIQQHHFCDEIEIEIIAQRVEHYFSNIHSHLHFMVGQVNFCTLLPMRAIPFKVVCLLGMNEGDFPRQQRVNHFDLMQYSYQKGDRIKRDDDNYLFLEALLSAQQQFYISYIGQSLTNNQETLPSILVTQLLDYLKGQLGEENHLSLVKKQAMTVFSLQNFTNGAISYDKEWLQAKSHAITTPDFATPLARDEQELPTNVELDSLIAYLQAPVKSFFNHHLGVVFEQYKEMLDAHEIFELSGLEQYKLLDDLIETEQETACYFEQAKLKGRLPHGEFGKLEIADITARSTLLQNVLANYLKHEKTRLEIDEPYQVTLPDGLLLNIRLQGYIHHCFDNEIVQWRVGDLREASLIKMWVYHLLLAANNQKITLRFYFLHERKQVNCLTFAPIEPNQAKQLLQIYLNDYFANFYRLTTACTQGLDKCFKKPKGSEHYELSLEALEKQLKESQTPSKQNYYYDPYWHRVCIQTTMINFNEIHQRTQLWFELMMSTKQIKEIQ